MQSVIKKATWRPFCFSEYVIGCYLLLSLLKNIHCLINCMHLSVLSKKLVIFIMHWMNVMSCYFQSMPFTMWAFKMSCCFCVKDLSIKMIYFVIFPSSLLFNVLSEFVFLTTMGPWQICNTLRFEQHDEHFVGTFFTK